MLPPPLLRLVQSYFAALRPATIGAGLGAVCAAVVAGAHLARQGTELTRFGALSLVSVALLLVGVRAWMQRRWVSSPERAVRSVVVSTQPETGRRILRALELAERPAARSPGESPELARLHYERMLARASNLAVTAIARERARRFSRFAVVAFGAVGLTVLVAPLHLLEGLNVALATRGVAPLPMQWLTDPELEATPPSYLRQEPVPLGFETAGLLPEGTELVVRAKRRHEGRTLVLTDGVREQAFADDGSGSLVARWEVTESTTLRAAARFGDVLIYEPRSIELYSQPDLAPRVELAGAPADVTLETMQRLELRWAAVDDHSIVEVELVLRSAGKEERRQLERYPGDKRQASGGHVLHPDDTFLQRLFLPATVHIEARDNDPREGTQWGKSPAFTIRPPSVGAPHLARYRALVSVRDRVVDLLAWVRAQPGAGTVQPAVNARATLGKELDQRLQAIHHHAQGVLRASYTGLSIPRGWITFANGQLQRLDQARAIAKGRPEPGVRAIEDTALGLDQALDSLAFRDAQAVSKQLANVADEAASGAKVAQGEKDQALGVERLDLAISVLGDGARQLKQLGDLGFDLGSVALADLERVKGSRKLEDYFHAELAALHMAARLRRPNPSFGAKGGGGGGGGGVESGEGTGGGQGSDAQGETSEAESEFDRIARELEELSEEHSQATERTGSALKDAEKQVNEGDMRDEAKRRAEELRRSVIRLPAPGEQPGTGRASAALSREHAGAMAHELERLGFEGAIESGRRALSAGKDALGKPDLGPELRQEMQRALDEVREQMAWAEEQLEKKNQLTEQAAREGLEKVSELEQELAERARRLAQEEGIEEALPGEAVERLERAQGLMRDAAGKLREGKGSEGLALQRDAQRLLEQAKPGRTDEDQGESGKPSDGQEHGGRRVGTGGDVPNPDEANQAEEFRRRVLQGLNRSKGGRLSPAIQRYAEGLLQ